MEEAWGKARDPHAEARQRCAHVRHGEREPLAVGHLGPDIRAKGARKPAYFDSRVTNKAITDMSAAHLAECSRTRRKIGSECHGVLRYRGYDLGRNFGRGNRRTADVYFPPGRIPSPCQGKDE